jgi:hypothetical protein
MKLDVQKLWEAIDNKRWEDRISSYRKLTKIVGGYDSTFTRIKQGHPPSADFLIAVLVWLDRPAKDFARSDD